jgi:hypothetical protein
LAFLAVAVPGALGQRIDPGRDLVYAGAFRLPGPSGGTSWEWGGRGLAHRADGDPGGGADGYPGSLFGSGHDHLGYLTEVSIPAPVVSPGKNLADLPVASTLRPFRNARAFDPNGEGEWIMCDLAVLPPQGAQSSPKLHQSWIRHAQFEKGVQFGWSELDLSRPVGGWYLGSPAGAPHQEALGRYLCALPAAWATAHTGGKRLVSGRFRDGGQQSCGPTLYAYAPWENGDPPPPGTQLEYVRLLHYDDFLGSRWLADYTHADDWVGVEWLAAADGRAAVAFIGTKGLGDYWYGFQDGARFPECLPACDGQEGRGWWAEEFRTRMMFYDPADLAAVAAGTLAPNRPQPYAVRDVDDVLFTAHARNAKDRIMSSAFDAGSGTLYVLEPWVDGDQPIVHVWRLRQETLAVQPASANSSAAASSGRRFAVAASGAWTARADHPWLEITAGAAGSGTGTVTYSVAANPGPARTGTIAVSGGGDVAVFTVYQWPPALHPRVSAEGDFDGDFQADYVTFQPTTGNWDLLFSGGGQWQVPFGSPTMVPVPADYDGDGLVDLALFQRATGDWYVFQSSGGSRKVRFGWNRTVPLPGDYDNDGRADFALFYPDQSTWYFLCTTEGGSSLRFGARTDVPVPADYDGDGAVDVAVYRPSSGQWFLVFSGGGSRVRQLGWAGTVPVPADYDGDGRADVAVLSRATSKWCISYSGGGGWVYAFGYRTMIPVPADYDGDGAADVAMYHPASGTWYVRESATGRHRRTVFGGPGRIPTLLNPLIHSWFGLP